MAAKPKPAIAKPVKPMNLFVAPDGRDSWSGRLPAPNARGTDGPLASVAGAQKAVRKLKVKGRLPAPVRVNLRGGTYFLRRSIVLGPGDSGSPMIRQQWRVRTGEMSVTYAAWRGETPVLSGGRVIEGFKLAALGDGRKVWVAPVPAAKSGKWDFGQLFVNGQRRFRPRLPKSGFYRVREILDAHPGGAPWRPGVKRFGYSGEDLKPWHNLKDVELVLTHLWMESRVKIVSLDAKTRVVHLDRQTNMRPIKTHLDEGLSPYWAENVFEAIEPGQWYLDRAAGKLYYMPLPGERLSDSRIVAPVLEEVLRLEGSGKGDRWVEALHFEGITFAHSQWKAPPKAAFLQASAEIPGGVVLRHARDCSFRNCRFTGHGQYALELLDGCRDVTIQGNLIESNEGGGIKVWHTSSNDQPPRTDKPTCDACRRISIMDNEIRDGGHKYLSAVGLLIGRCCGNKVLHNHIHHFFYTGISVGWTWGYGDENNAYGNIIEHNHVHHIGQGMLSDMGGIYTLGLAQGTRIRFNVFHDVVARGYGGWGIYPDEGSSDLLIENNLVYDCNRSSFHQHFGKNNLVQNNIFALAGEAQLAITRGEDHMTAIFARNIVYFDKGTMLGAPEAGFMEGYYSPRNVTFERNLYFNASGRGPVFLGRSWRQWRKLGFDKGSVVADPLFGDVRNRDFALRPGSPAFALGFRQIDLSDVGPRAQHRYTAPGRLA